MFAFFVAPPRCKRMAFASSGETFLSIQHKILASNLATIREADTKPVLTILATLVDVSCIKITVGKSRSALEVTQLSPLLFILKLFDQEL